MIQYIYFVKCPHCEDEPFDFFDEAKEFACSCMSKKPIITQVEVDRNDFGECVDSCDLGTIWSWEDVMKETDAEPAVSVFTKDDLKILPTSEDPEFDSLDNSLDFKIDEIPDNFRKPVLEETQVDSIDSVEAIDRELISLVQSKIKGPLADRVGSSGFYSGNGQRFMVIPVSTNSDAYDFDSYKRELRHVFPTSEIYSVMDDYEIVVDVTSFYRNNRKPIPEGMTIKQLVEEMEENEDTVECTWCNDLFDKDQCRKEVNLGYLCSRCEAAIKSRGEKLTFEENNYWDFLDESASSTKPFDPEEKVELEYKNIEVTVELGRDQGWDDYYGGWDEPIEKDLSGDFTYEVDALEVASVIWEEFLDDDLIMSLPGGPEAMECDRHTDEASLKFWGLHFEDLLKKYYDKLLEFFREDALEAAKEEFANDYLEDDYPEDDYFEDDLD